MQPVLLSTAYLPPVSYFSVLLQKNEVLIESHENFIKQTYRNRCEILSANGKLSLSIPLRKNGDKELITQKMISYAENWQIRHWRAITSAYKNSAYFDFFEEEFKPFYFSKHEFLFNYNLELIQLILKLLRIKKELKITSEFQKEFMGLDLRNSINPKTTNTFQKVRTPDKYYQVFSDKFNFIPDLSIIDLLFNKGLETKDYLSLKI